MAAQRATAARRNVVLDENPISHGGGRPGGVEYTPQLNQATLDRVKKFVCVGRSSDRGRVPRESKCIGATSFPSPRPWISGHSFKLSIKVEELLRTSRNFRHFSMADRASPVFPILRVSQGNQRERRVSLSSTGYGMNGNYC